MGMPAIGAPTDSAIWWLFWSSGIKDHFNGNIPSILKRHSEINKLCRMESMRNRQHAYFMIWVYCISLQWLTRDKIEITCPITEHKAELMCVMKLHDKKIVGHYCQIWHQWLISHSESIWPLQNRKYSVFCGDIQKPPAIHMYIKCTMQTWLYSGKASKLYNVKIIEDRRGLRIWSRKDWNSLKDLFKWPMTHRN